MKSQLKKIKDCKMKLMVEVEPERVEERYQEVLKSIQGAVTLPGFRQGKAPADLVEKKYSKEAEEELLKNIIPESYHQSVATHKVAPVSLPAIGEIQFQRGKKLTFTAEFESAPDFSLKNYKGIKLKRADETTDDADVEKAIASLLESRAELIDITPLRPVQKGDFIVADIEIFQNGKFNPGRKNAVLYVDQHPEDDFLEKIIGANVDEVREIMVDHSPEEKAQGLVGRKPLYKVWVRGLQEKKLPELNDDFAKHFEKETVEELKLAVRRDVAGYKRSEAHHKMKNELYDKLLEMHSFAVPEGLLEKQAERLVTQAKNQGLRSGMPQAAIEKEIENIQRDAKEKAERQLRLYFILNSIFEKEDIEIDETALITKLEQLAQESQRPMDEVRRMFEEDLRESLKEEKTVDFLLANAKFEEEKKGDKK